MGSGTTAKVCNNFNLNWIGSELNPENVELANKRLLINK
jgi:DNA modification methylase